MLDLSQIAGFDWDEGNNRKSVDKHHVTQEEAEQVFLDPRLLIFRDESHSDEENRYHAFGQTAARRRLQVSFTLRRGGSLIRVISGRPMSRKERARYEEEA
jgi:hypothetical protein